jgi:hypothetical protein
VAYDREIEEERRHVPRVFRAEGVR